MTLPNRPTKHMTRRDLLGQATRQKAAPCLLSSNQVRLWQPVVLHHPGGRYYETGFQFPEMGNTLGMGSYLYPALMVACEGSCSRVSNQSDSKGRNQCKFISRQIDIGIFFFGNLKLAFRMTNYLSSVCCRQGCSCRQQSTRCSQS